MVLFSRGMPCVESPRTTPSRLSPFPPSHCTQRPSRNDITLSAISGMAQNILVVLYLGASSMTWPAAIRWHVVKRTPFIQKRQIELSFNKLPQKARPLCSKLEISRRGNVDFWWRRCLMVEAGLVICVL